MESMLSMASIRSMVWLAGRGAAAFVLVSKHWNGGARVFPSIGTLTAEGDLKIMVTKS